KGNANMSPNSMITRVYQTLSEVLFFYLLLIPIFNIERIEPPFWGYVGAAVSGLLLLFIMRHYVRNYSAYVLAAPLLLLIVVGGFGFPLFSGALLAGVMLWRFIAHQTSPDMQNQMPLLV